MRSRNTGSVSMAHIRQAAIVESGGMRKGIGRGKARSVNVARMRYVVVAGRGKKFKYSICRYCNE